jgi:hypothetical protein
MGTVEIGVFARDSLRPIGGGEEDPARLCIEADLVGSAIRFALTRTAWRAPIGNHRLICWSSRYSRSAYIATPHGDFL